MARNWKIAAALLLAAALLAGCAAGKLTDNEEEKTTVKEEETLTQVYVSESREMGNAGAGEEGRAEGQVDLQPPVQPDDPAVSGADQENRESETDPVKTLPDKTLPDGETLGPPVGGHLSGHISAVDEHFLKPEDLNAQVTYVNWSEIGEAAFMSWALEFTEGRVAALEDRKTLDSFLDDLGGYFSLGSEEYGFRGLAAAWDDDFFAEEVLLVVYLPSGSGSNRFLLRSAEIRDHKLSLRVECQFPEIGTCDMAGWFLSIELPRTVWNQVRYVGMDIDAVMMSSDR